MLAELKMGRWGISEINNCREPPPSLGIEDTRGDDVIGVQEPGYMTGSGTYRRRLLHNWMDCAVGVARKNWSRGWAAQQELDRGWDTATARDAAKGARRGEILSILPSSCPPVYSLCPCWPNRTMKPGDKGAWEMQVAGSAPCGSEVSRKGRGVDLSTNRPTTGARHLPHLALIFLPFLMSTPPCPLVLFVVSGLVRLSDVFRLCYAHSHSLVLCADRNLEASNAFLSQSLIHPSNGSVCPHPWSLSPQSHLWASHPPNLLLIWGFLECCPWSSLYITLLGNLSGWFHPSPWFSTST